MTKEIPGVFYDDPKMSENHLEQVNILSKDECSTLWQKFVSAKNRHFILLDSSEWAPKIIAENSSWYCWFQDWNNDDFSTFTTMLSTLPIPNESELHVFWMQEIGITTTWNVFCQNWSNFLYEDEGVILVIPDSDISVILSNGSAWYGTRS